MRSTLSLLACALWALPALAEAQPVKLVAHQVSTEGLTLVLDAPGPETEPRIRTRRRSMRIWVPVEGSIARFELHRSEGQPYHVDVRPGAASTLLVRVDGPHAFEAEDVTFEREGPRLRVEIRNPDAMPAAPAAKPEAADTDVQPQAPVETKAAQSQANHAQPESGPQPKPASPSASHDSDVIKTAADPSTSPLVWVTAVLALAAVVLKLRRPRKNAHERDPDIAIVGRKHLGPRHQLMVVRALGEDHLLSVQGGRVERLGSSPTGAFATGLAASTTARAASDEKPSEPRPSLGSPEGKKRLRLLFDRSEEPAEDTGVSFKGALSSLVGKLDAEASAPANDTESPAVRGLRELRRRQVS